MRSTGKTRQPLVQICGLALFALIAFSSAHAQTVVGRIAGTVQDANGASVPNATIKVINSATNSERTVTFLASANGNRRPGFSVNWRTRTRRS